MLPHAVPELLQKSGWLAGTSTTPTSGPAPHHPPPSSGSQAQPEERRTCCQGAVNAHVCLTIFINFDMPPT